MKRRRVAVVAPSMRALAIRLARLFRYDTEARTYIGRVPDRAVVGRLRAIRGLEVTATDCRALARTLRNAR